MACALATFFTAKAAEIPVASGADLQKAIDDASSGDVLILDDGGLYDQNQTLIMDGGKELTFKAQAGAAVKPEVITDGFRFGQTATSGIIAEGIEFNGSYSGDYFIKADQAGDGAKFIKLINCEVHAYNNGLMGLWGEPKCYVDTVLFSNCYFHDLDSEGGWMCQFLSFGSRACIKHYRMENSTIDGYNELFINYDNAEYVIKMEFDHCTFHRKIGEHGDARNTFSVNAAEGSSFTMTNCIISSLDPNGTESFLFDIKPTVTDIIKNTIFHDVDGIYSTDNEWTEVENYVETDPQYEAPESYDLTLKSGSPALTFATDGGPVGDPRWAGINVGVKNITESGVHITTHNNQVYFSETVSIALMHSLNGKQLMHETQTQYLSLDALPGGVYVVSITDNNGAKKSLKIVR